MIRKLIVIALIVLVVGLYFYPDATKDAMDTAGMHVKDFGSNIFEESKERASEGTEKIIDNIKEGYSK